MYAGDLLGQWYRQRRRQYLHTNQQGSVIAATSPGGVVDAINTYDAYGIPGDNNQGRFAYTGQLYLPSLGLYYYKARIYNPELGRFMQTDPVGYEDQMNLYAYVGNDPINLSDPSGMCIEDACIVEGTLVWTAIRALIFTGTATYAAKEASDAANDSESDSGESASESDTSSGEKPRFIGDGKGEIVDTEATPKGRYQQPDGGRTDVLQDEDHGAGRNHTHRPKTNTNPNTGETFVNGLGEGTPVTEEDVNNITSDVAKPLPPRGR